MATGRVSIRGSVTGLVGGPGNFAPADQILSTPEFKVIEQVLASGDNTILIPSGATYCQIVPPTNNAIALSLGTAGAGGEISKFRPMLLSFPATTPASFILRAGSVMTDPIEFRFM